MNRSALEHVLRAAAAITGLDEFVIVGSQSVLGQYADAPAALLVSDEVDLYPLADPEMGELVEGAIGEGSPFHDRFGYYAQAVAERTSILPPGWKQRPVRLSNANTGAGIGLCLALEDLLVAKLMAGREKDLAYARTAFVAGLADPAVVQERIGRTETLPELRDAALARLTRTVPRS
jgi:hypothetical protein